MKSNIIPFIVNTFYYFRITFGDPFDNKECRFLIMTFQYQRSCPYSYIYGKDRFPILSRFSRFIVQQVKPLFNIESKNIHILFCFSGICFITFAGRPTAIVQGGISLVTIEPAPIIAPSPIVTPGITIVPIPNMQPFLKMIFFL